ncbi:unnamed protein product [Urochloa humidicola]
MPAASENTSWPRWHNLPSDLLEDISGRLHAAADYARFHAACKPWRYSLPPAARRPTFLSWLLLPRAAAATGHRAARCVLSSSTATTDLHDRDRTWVIRAEDGVAYWLVAGEKSSGAGLVDPLTGTRAATLPPFPDEIVAWVSRADAAAGIIYGNGTIVFYALCPTALYSSDGPKVTSNAAASDLRTLNVALMCPGTCDAAAWTSVQTKLCLRSKDMEILCVACNNGNIILCHKRSFGRIVPAQPPEQPFSEPLRWQYWSLHDEPGAGNQERFQSSYYLVEFRGELLLARAEINNTYWKSWDCNVDVISFAKGLSVLVYVLLDGAQGVRRAPQWVKRDGRSFLADRVLFLGRPSSFAVEAVRLGMDGGCAYFLDKRRLYQGNVVRDRCRLLKYSFHDGWSEFVEELPAQWTCKAGMWITPQPAIATSQL